jgi:glucose-6-phosphate isomerase
MAATDAGVGRFERYRRLRAVLDDPPLELDLADADLRDEQLAALDAPLRAALEAMRDLEKGALANRDERRMVGHYWLRAPARAPDAETSETIRTTIAAVLAFAERVHRGQLGPPEGGTFAKVLMLGIGGSALGPMLIADAFAGPGRAMALHVLDNTDPDGIDRMLAAVGSLHDTLVIVASKSGGTPETRNGMLEVAAACAAEGLGFASRAVAITMPDSALARRAEAEGWLATFPIPDWVGGRTSQFSAVGLVPAALQGIDVRALLAGAAAMDERTRDGDPATNPAALLAAFWHAQGRGRGERAMVVLPYKDRLLLFSRYLQQLVMESLGKQHDRAGDVVEQGLSVFGNKGSTDQHAYVQQLRDGRHDFFVVFVRVLEDRAGASIEVEPGATSGDYLDGLLQGTRRALAERGRGSTTITLERVDERSVGALIALFERAVGLYAELIDVNAYHQPGVEAGKRAAAAVLELQRRILAALDGEPRTAAELARRLGADAFDVWMVLRHLAANRTSVQVVGAPDPDTARFRRGKP